MLYPNKKRYFDKNDCILDALHNSSKFQEYPDGFSLRTEINGKQRMPVRVEKVHSNKTDGFAE